MSSTPSHADLIALDVDTRIYSFLLGAWDEVAGDEATIAGYLRLAYGRGYVDGITEEVRGALHRDHGLEVPPRKGRSAP